MQERAALFDGEDWLYQQLAQLPRPVELLRAGKQCGGRKAVHVAFVCYKSSPLSFLPMLDLGLRSVDARHVASAPPEGFLHTRSPWFSRPRRMPGVAVVVATSDITSLLPDPTQIGFSSEN